MIANGTYGIVTLIKVHPIIQNLQHFTFAEKQRMTITTFQKKNGVLKTELLSEIGLDTEERSIALLNIIFPIHAAVFVRHSYLIYVQGVPDVQDETLKDLLFAPTKCICDAEKLKMGSHVSIEGRVKMVRCIIFHIIYRIII